MSTRLGGGERAAAGLIGTRIAAGSERAGRSEPRDQLPPAWLYELDEYEGAEEISLALHSELGEVLSARIEGIGPQTPAPVGEVRGGERVIRGCEGRTRCPKTTA